jgi:hypothetical protein
MIAEPMRRYKLGDLTDELADYGHGAFIFEFLSLGPKNYAYKVSLPIDIFRTVCKVRGILSRK